MQNTDSGKIFTEKYFSPKTKFKKSLWYGFKALIYFKYLHICYIHIIN